MSLLLGSHSRAEHIGELKQYRKGFSACSNPACQESGRCDLTFGIDQVVQDQIYEQLFANTAAGVSHLVDASKKPTWFKALAKDNRYNVFLIHLLRDPRAICRRWLQRFEQPSEQNRARIRLSRKLPHRCLGIMATDPINLCIEKWIAENQAINKFIERSGRPALSVTYRELAANTADTLSRICQFSHLNFEQSQIKYWRYNHHGTWKPEYEWIKEQGTTGYFDQRWKSDLSPCQLEKFTRHSGLKQYLKSHSLVLDDHGLSLRCPGY